MSRYATSAECAAILSVLLGVKVSAEDVLLAIERGELVTAYLYDWWDEPGRSDGGPWIVIPQPPVSSPSPN
jgi:hypothetical protein